MMEHYTKFFLDKNLIRARKKQFWWICFNKLPHCIEVLTQCPEFLVKHTASGKEKKSSFHFLCRKQLSRHCRKTNANRRSFFCWLFGKDIRKQTIFQKAHFSSKFPSCYVECCFGSFAWIIPLNGWKLSA